MLLRCFGFGCHGPEPPPRGSNDGRSCKINAQELAHRRHIWDVSSAADTRLLFLHPVEQPFAALRKADVLFVDAHGSTLVCTPVKHGSYQQDLADALAWVIAAGMEPAASQLQCMLQHAAGSPAAVACPPAELLLGVQWPHTRAETSYVQSAASTPTVLRLGLVDSWPQDLSGGRIQLWHPADAGSTHPAAGTGRRALIVQHLCAYWPQPSGGPGTHVSEQQPASMPVGALGTPPRVPTHKMRRASAPLASFGTAAQAASGLTVSDHSPLAVMQNLLHEAPTWATAMLVAEQIIGEAGGSAHNVALGKAPDTFAARGRSSSKVVSVMAPGHSPGASSYDSMMLHHVPFILCVVDFGAPPSAVGMESLQSGHIEVSGTGCSPAPRTTTCRMLHQNLASLEHAGNWVTDAPSGPTALNYLKALLTLEDEEQAATAASEEGMGAQTPVSTQVQQEIAAAMHAGTPWVCVCRVPADINPPPLASTQPGRGSIDKQQQVTMTLQHDARHYASSMRAGQQERPGSPNHHAQLIHDEFGSIVPPAPQQLSSTAKNSGVTWADAGVGGTGGESSKAERSDGPEPTPSEAQLLATALLSCELEHAPSVPGGNVQVTPTKPQPNRMSRLSNAELSAAQLIATADAAAMHGSRTSRPSARYMSGDSSADQALSGSHHYEPVRSKSFRVPKVHSAVGSSTENASFLYNSLPKPGVLLPALRTGKQSRARNSFEGWHDVHDDVLRSASETSDAHAAAHMLPLPRPAQLQSALMSSSNAIFSRGSHRGGGTIPPSQRLAALLDAQEQAEMQAALAAAGSPAGMGSGPGTPRAHPISIPANASRMLALKQAAGTLLERGHGGSGDHAYLFDTTGQLRSCFQNSANGSASNAHGRASMECFTKGPARPSSLPSETSAQLNPMLHIISKGRLGSALDGSSAPISGSTAPAIISQPSQPVAPPRLDATMPHESGALTNEALVRPSISDTYTLTRLTRATVGAPSKGSAPTTRPGSELSSTTPWGTSAAGELDYIGRSDLSGAPLDHCPAISSEGQLETSAHGQQTPTAISRTAQPLAGTCPLMRGASLQLGAVPESNTIMESLFSDHSVASHHSAHRTPGCGNGQAGGAHDAARTAAGTPATVECASSSSAQFELSDVQGTSAGLDGNQHKAAAGEQEEEQEEQEVVVTEFCWHEITAIPLYDASLGRHVALLMQVDVTERHEMERRLMMLTQAQLSLLEHIFPRHILEQLARMSASASAPAPTLDPTPAAAGAQTGDPPMGGHTPVLSMSALTQMATYHPMVTVLFADCVGFTSMSQQVPPASVMTFLNNLFSQFDERLGHHGVWKVETAGDAYLIAGGLIDQDEAGFKALATQDNDDVSAHARAAATVLRFAFDMLEAASRVMLPHTGQPAQIRIGIHTGPVVSGLVGVQLPKFSLFGDTMNHAARLESTSKSGCIHVSDTCHDLLEREVPGLPWHASGGVMLKGKGVCQTYLLDPYPSAPESQLHALPTPVSTAHTPHAGQMAPSTGHVSPVPSLGELLVQPPRSVALPDAGAAYVHNAGVTFAGAVDVPRAASPGVVSQLLQRAVPHIGQAPNSHTHRVVRRPNNACDDPPRTRLGCGAGHGQVPPLRHATTQLRYQPSAGAASAGGAEEAVALSIGTLDSARSSTSVPSRMATGVLRPGAGGTGSGPGDESEVGLLDLLTLRPVLPTQQHTSRTPRVRPSTSTSGMAAMYSPSVPGRPSGPAHSLSPGQHDSSSRLQQLVHKKVLGASGRIQRPATWASSFASEGAGYINSLLASLQQAQPSSGTHLRVGPAAGPVSPQAHRARPQPASDRLDIPTITLRSSAGASVGGDAGFNAHEEPRSSADAQTLRMLPMQALSLACSSTSHSQQPTPHHRVSAAAQPFSSPCVPVTVAPTGTGSMTGSTLQRFIAAGPGQAAAAPPAPNSRVVMSHWEQLRKQLSTVRSIPGQAAAHRQLDGSTSARAEPAAHCGALSHSTGGVHHDSDAHAPGSPFMLPSLRGSMPSLHAFTAANASGNGPSSVQLDLIQSLAAVLQPGAWGAHQSSEQLPPATFLSPKSRPSTAGLITDSTHTGKNPEDNLCEIRASYV